MIPFTELKWGKEITKEIMSGNVIHNKRCQSIRGRISVSQTRSIKRNPQTNITEEVAERQTEKEDSLLWK